MQAMWAMWEAPNQAEAGRPRADRGGDALGGPPDSGRPANPWPRLIAFAVTVLACVFLAGLCVVSFATPPKRELKVDVGDLTVGVPLFLPVTTFGADHDGNTYGAWLTVLPDRTVALLSLEPASRCDVKWEPTTKGNDQVGAFVDRCSAARFDVGGTMITGADRDLDAFPTRRTGTSIYVDVTQITLGACRAANATACSAPGQPQVRKVPEDALPPNFGRE